MLYSIHGMKALLEQSCDRLIEDEAVAGGGLPGRALTFLSMSGWGLTETELRTLLFKHDASVGGSGSGGGGGGGGGGDGSGGKEEMVPYADWAYTLLKIKHLIASCKDPRCIAHLLALGRTPLP